MFRQLNRILAFLFNVTIVKGNLFREFERLSPVAIPRHLFDGAILLPDRIDVLSFLPADAQCAEVGVAYGDFSEKILDVVKPSVFYAIDAFGELPIRTNTGSKELDHDTETDHFKFYKNRFESQFQSGVLKMIKNYSWNGINDLSNEAIDYFYIDADHSYTSVKKDIVALLPKLRKGGLVQFNDYTFFDQDALMPYGVVTAVNELLVEHNWKIKFFCFEKKGFYDIVIQKPF